MSYIRTMNYTITSIDETTLTTEKVLSDIFGINSRVGSWAKYNKYIVSGLDDPDSTLYLSVRNDRVIGYAQTTSFDYGLRLRLLAVDPNYRKQGVFKALINRIFELTNELHLTVRSTNTVAIDVWDRMTRHGYATKGLRPSEEEKKPLRKFADGDLRLSVVVVKQPKQ